MVTKRSIAKTVFLTFTLMTMIMVAFVPPIKGQIAEIRVVNPLTGESNFLFHTNTTSKNDHFNVTLRVYDVNNLDSFQVFLTYNYTLLEPTENVWIPTNDPEYVFVGRSSFPVWSFFYNHSYWGWSVGVGDAIISGTSFNGSGLLAIIEFRAIYEPIEGETVSANFGYHDETGLYDPIVSEISSIKTPGHYQYSWAPPIDYPVHNLDSGLNYTSIQGAINAPETLNGHTIFVEVGDYYEHIEINKSISLVGENRSTTVIDGDGTGIVVNIARNNVNITGFTVQNGEYGIQIFGFDLCDINFNIITENNRGIYIIGQNITIANNTVSSNNEYGIHLNYSIHSNLTGNRILSNEDGIILRYANHNTLRKNTVLLNSNTGIVLQASSNDNILASNTISQSSFGILLWNVSDNSLSNNNISKNRMNFGVWGNFKNSVDTNNTVDGKSILYLINATGSTYNKTTDAGVIFLINCTNITVHDLILANNFHGMILFNTTQSNIKNITISNNWVGIGISHSNNNMFTENTISGNEVGLQLDSIENTFFHNNFLNNTDLISLHTDSTNTWDNDYPSGGNYWSNYDGLDLFTGLSQTETGSDGIGDVPFVLDANNTDYYPLMGMFFEFSATTESTIQVICNSSISGYHFNGSAISFNVTGEDGTTGFCRISIPTVLMNETYNILINGTQVPYRLLPVSNATHNYLYFTYSHSTQEVIIIPEFPSLIILPMLMILMVLTAIAHKRSHFTK